jgi:hypothetical protein
MVRETMSTRLTRRDEYEPVPIEDVTTEIATGTERRPERQDDPQPVRREPTLSLLMSAPGLRQAMLLQEILGTPIGLRRPGSDSRNIM